ncbi:hypothetical protein BD626DRAFT_627585 [Schizophyllum amplum]|uniref:Uncharacterized protein n=1 Tax=Schizophyllum amplum TaxID=97359 RepID=A0A550CQW9_9AGAR|nr:hypothetical protein BD626DRAFT_627585 [Auriculariopsis ampla]
MSPTDPAMYSSSAGYAAYSFSASSSAYSSSASSSTYSSSSSSSAYPSSASPQAYPSSARGYPLSSATPSTDISSGNSSVELRQASFSTTRSSFESEQATARGIAPVSSSALSSASSAPLPPSRSPAGQRRAMRPKIPAASTPGGLVRYIYVGAPTNHGRNVLQRVEGLTADPIIRSFGTHKITMTNIGPTILPDAVWLLPDAVWLLPDAVWLLPDAVWRESGTTRRRAGT